jgi:hypothetical protein
MTTPPPITRDGAQHDARHELSKAIYHLKTDPLPVRAVKWFGHLVDRIFSSTATHAPAGDFGALALIIVVVVLLALLVWRVGVPRGAATASDALVGASTLSASAHRRLSAEAADRNDWLTAVIERMRALAGELEERSILVPRAGRTASELTREAAVGVPAAQAPLAAAADTFNAVVYGGRRATAAHVEVIAIADDAIRAAARSTVVAA